MADLSLFTFQQSFGVQYSRPPQQAVDELVVVVGGERAKLVSGQLERQSTSALERQTSFGSSGALQSLLLQRDSMQTSLSGEVAPWHLVQVIRGAC